MNRFSGIWLCAALCIALCAVLMPISCARALNGEPKAMPTPTPTPELFIAPTEEAPGNADDGTNDGEAGEAENAEELSPDEDEPEAAQNDAAENGEDEEPEAAPDEESDKEEAPADEPEGETAQDNAEEPAEPAPQPEIGCNDPGCPHVSLDDTGSPVAICPLGVSMLNSGAKNEREPESTADTQPPTVIFLRDGENTIFEDGVYVLSGGGVHARLEVARGLDVEISLNGAELLNLGLREDVAAKVRFEGQNSIYTIAAPGATLTLEGAGCLNGVRNINSKELNVLGGSVSLPVYAHSANGRTPYVFNAEGATTATVNGKPYPFTCPQDGGLACLWLPTLTDGEYTAAVIDGVLTITSD